ncbi:MAG: sigma-54 dependent transcriptional regulator [Candidatus Aminicenantaceae bacterium]
MTNEKILIIDDEAGIRSSLHGVLEDEGYSIRTTSTGEKALEFLMAEEFDLVFLDIWLPEMNGIEVLKKIREQDKKIQVVMITGHGSVESAVESTKLGAFNFLEKPLSLEKVVLTAKNALRQKKLEEENIQLQEKLRSRLHLVGRSPSMQRLRKEAAAAAPTDGRVLIMGESGTGKELVARLIHQRSERRNKRFIQVSAAAIPDELIEDELFGHTRDAFPNAKRDKKGLMLLADGGTLFLDDIGELSLKTQAKLTRIIEEGRFEPLGSEDSLAADVRIIAATDKDLRKLTLQRAFLEELFFKLNVIPMAIPPLRERKEDIPVLIHYYLKRFAREAGKKQKTMSPEAMQAFINYAWPGNVSELINVLERFVIMIKEDRIEASHLYLLVEPRESQFINGLAESLSLIAAREHFDREYINNALLRNDWDLAKAAKDLNIDVPTLEANIRRLNIRFLG